MARIEKTSVHNIDIQKKHTSEKREYNVPKNKEILHEHVSLSFELPVAGLYSSLFFLVFLCVCVVVVVYFLFPKLKFVSYVYLSTTINNKQVKQ